MVGALVVRGGTVLAESFHQRAGEAHAEVRALDAAGAGARGAALYVSMEPCVHFGRTPPCVPRVVASGVRRVVICARDPNPRVHGRGVAALRRAGLHVTLAGSPHRELAERLNEKFALWVRLGRPFVLAKWAATLDGKTASATGESRWITGKDSRRRAMAFREEYDGVLVGAGTILADDPRLSRRLGLNRTTLHRRIVLDGRLRVPPSARVFREPDGAIVVTALSTDHPRARELTRRGVAVWSLPGRGARRVPLRRLLSKLGREGVASLMIEGGAETLGSFFEADLVDRVAVFTAPMVLGGARASGGVGGAGLALPAARRIVEVGHEKFGDDWMVTGRVVRR